MPILADRSLLLTVSKENKEHIRVNIVPQRIESDSKLAKDIKANGGDVDEAIQSLTKPVTLVGTPEEIDVELSIRLKEYVANHQEASLALVDQRDALAEVAKNAKAAAEAARKGKAVTKPAASPAAASTAKAEPAKPEKKQAAHAGPVATASKTASARVEAPDIFSLWEQGGATMVEDTPAEKPADPKPGPKSGPVLVETPAEKPKPEPKPEAVHEPLPEEASVTSADDFFGEAVAEDAEQDDPGYTVEHTEDNED